MNKITQTFSKNLEKYVYMNSFLEPATLLKMNFFLGILFFFFIRYSSP